MRLALLIATLIMAVPACVHAEEYWAPRLLFGGSRTHQGAWCGHQDVGANTVQEDCSFDTFEQCKFATMGVNNGFCTQRYIEPTPPRGKKRRAYQY